MSFTNLDRWNQVFFLMWHWIVASASRLPITIRPDILRQTIRQAWVISLINILHLIALKDLWRKSFPRVFRKASIRSWEKRRHCCKKQFNLGYSILFTAYCTSMCICVCAVPACVCSQGAWLGVLNLLVLLFGETGCIIDDGLTGFYRAEEQNKSVTAIGWQANTPIHYTPIQYTPQPSHSHTGTHTHTYEDHEGHTLPSDTTCSYKDLQVHTPIPHTCSYPYLVQRVSKIVRGNTGQRLLFIAVTGQAS